MGKPLSVLLTLFSVGVASAFYVVPWSWSPALLALAVVAGVAGCVTRQWNAVHASLLAVVLVGGAVLRPAWLGWPWSTLVPCVAYVVVIGVTPVLRRTATGLRAGSFPPRERRRVLIIVGLTAATLVGWYTWAQPDISDLKTLVPAAPFPLLALGGVALALLNALLEEALWRGVMMEALDQALGPGRWSVALQAASFGCAHAYGFPRGASGMALAALYGLFLGRLRRRTGGLLAPVLAHTGADITIFAILCFLVP